MKSLTLRIAFVALAFCAIAALHASAAEPATTRLRVMAWNILNGGRADGETEGPKRVVDVIRDSGADLVAMQETYGNGDLINRGLGFRFRTRGAHLSIHSRFPIGEDISVSTEARTIGAIIELPGGQRVAFYSIWLPFKGDIWQPGSRTGKTTAEMLAVCEPSRADLEKILAAVTARLSDKKYDGVPIIIAGDFNSMSHLDYTEAAKPQYQHVIEWPTSRVLTEAGFRDSYREINPKVDRKKDRTWSPRFTEQEVDRIDFIYHRGPVLKATASGNIDTHAKKFPSDHAAVVTDFRLGN